MSLIRVGHGYDLHRLEPVAPAGAGRPLRLGGILIPSDRGPVSHSDGDALLHAITDALLGALGAPDIGELFPDVDPANAGRDSADFLRDAARRTREAGMRLTSLDATVILQRPKLAPHKPAIRALLAELLEVEPDIINIKGKTGEQIGPVGEGRAVEVHAIVALVGDTE